MKKNNLTSRYYAEGFETGMAWLPKTQWSQQYDNVKVRNAILNYLNHDFHYVHEQYTDEETDGNAVIEQWTAVHSVSPTCKVITQYYYVDKLLGATTTVYELITDYER